MAEKGKLSKTLDIKKAATAVQSKMLVNEPVEIPEWVGETPEDLEYELTVFKDCCSEQIVEMTREEFLYLKQCLAIRRGYIAATSEAIHAEAA